MRKFNFIETIIPDLYVIESLEGGSDWTTYNDEFIPYVHDIYGNKCKYVQENISMSRQAVLRGIHMQVNNPQGKLVRVLEGKVFDVAVDARKGNETFGMWYGVELSAENRRQLLIPEGFLHGFLVLSEKALFTYKCTRFYDPNDQYGVMWNDKDINIQWPLPLDKSLNIAERDTKNHTFDELVSLLNSLE